MVLTTARAGNKQASQAERPQLAGLACFISQIRPRGEIVLRRDAKGLALGLRTLP